MPDQNLEISSCRSRQARLIAHFETLGVDAAVFTRPEHVQWLTGFRPFRLHCAIAALFADGTCALVAPDATPENVAADKFAVFATNFQATIRDEREAAAAEALATVWPTSNRPKRVAVEFNALYPLVKQVVDAELVDIDETMWTLRRTKDSDELAMMRIAISGTGAMYARAREIIEPGINELDVYSQLYQACTLEFEEPPLVLGNDFQCGTPGGPPRNRKAQDGELYILDLGPCYRGYNADNCRTICVNGEPTDEQYAAWGNVARMLELVETLAKPGESCKALYTQVKSELDAFLPGAFFHHLGHGVGLFPHERPRLNPNWDDTLQPGDVFTVEPGVYSKELAGGIRLENNYLVTDNGIELLTDFPLELI